MPSTQSRHRTGGLLGCVLMILLVGGLRTAHGQMSFLKSSQDYELSDVMAEADEFVRLDAYWEAYATSPDGDRQLVGYVFLSDDLVEIPAYSGKSMNTLIGLDLDAAITGIKIVQHSEPIVLLGLKEGVIYAFGDQYVGKSIRERIIISGVPREGYTAIDAITGATVTAIAGNATILEASRLVAKQTGLVKGAAISNRILRTDFVEKSWNALVAEGSIANLVVTPQDVSDEGDEPVVDLWFTILNPPTIGINLLGEHQAKLMEERVAQGHAAVFIGSRGSISFKGSGFARGGIFDRFSLEQGGDVFICKDVDYINVTRLDDDMAPQFEEGGIFFVGGSFDPTADFTFHLTIPFRVNDVRSYATFSEPFHLPGEYVEEEVPYWKMRWQAEVVTLIAFLLFVASVVLQFLFRMQLARRQQLLHPIRIFTWSVAAIVVGLGWKAQPSTTQMLTFFTSAIEGRFPAEIYLSEPMIFLFWCIIVLSTPLWGRGFFCGTLCPYGGLLEVLRLPYEKLVPKSRRKAIDEWTPPTNLRRLKYVVLVVVLAVSVVSLTAAEVLAEVEPFKTFILRLVRPQMFVLYFVAVTLASVVWARGFCRFVCPLGAALALPFGRPLVKLDRYDHCGTCRICEHECLPRAITREGDIDLRECFQCWDCQDTMQNTARCPVLINPEATRKSDLAKVAKATTTTSVLFLFLAAGPAFASTWTVSQPADSLQSVVNSAALGDTVKVAAGIYPGQLLVREGLVILGDEGAILDGGGQGHVVMIDESEVTFSGFTVRASGDDMENADAGIWVSQESSGVRILHNTIIDCRFGIWINGSPTIEIVGNTVKGRAHLDKNSRGDGIHFWDTHGAIVTDNYIVDARDGIYMELSTECQILRNDIRRSRYSIHTMWCDRSTYNDNVASENLVGLALMFSKGLEAVGNTVHNNATHGLLLIQVTRSVARDNRVIGNTKGMFVYNSLYNTIEGNLIANNSLGIHYWAGSEDNAITNNSLVQNKIQVKFVAAKDQTWAGNFWTDYTGWDGNGDGHGDTAYRSHTLVDALLWEFPAAKLLLASPAFQVLAGAERTFPVLSAPKVIDPTPLMHPTIKNWREVLAQYPPLPQNYYGTLQKLPHIPGG